MVFTHSNRNKGKVSGLYLRHRSLLSTYTTVLCGQVWAGKGQPISPPGHDFQEHNVFGDYHTTLFVLLTRYNSYSKFVCF